MEKELEGKELQRIEQDTAPFLEKAQSLEIDCPERLAQAVDLVKDITRMTKLIEDETFGPLVKAAHKQHKDLLATQRRFTDPLSEAKDMLRERVAAYLEEELDTDVEAIQGLSVRTDSKPVVTDKMEIIRAAAKLKLPHKILKVDNKVLKDLIDAGLEVPGVSVTKTVTPVIRSA
jgi:hypothetical protein